jgi:hypothetical protein
LRFVETPEFITSALRALNIVYTTRIDTRAGKFNGSTCLFVRDGQHIPKLMKLIRPHFSKEDGVYVRRKVPVIMNQSDMKFLVPDPAEQRDLQEPKFE